MRFGIESMQFADHFMKDAPAEGFHESPAEPEEWEGVKL